MEPTEGIGARLTGLGLETQVAELTDSVLTGIERFEEDGVWYLADGKRDESESPKGSLAWKYFYN